MTLAKRWLILLGGSLLAILLQGVAVPNNAHSYHWPIVLDWLRSAEGPHDAFTQSLDNYLSHFYTLLGWIADEASIVPLYYLLHVVTMLAIAAALRRIYRTLTTASEGRVTWAAAFTPVVLHAFVDSLLGHGEVLLDSLSHSSVIVAFVLWGWALALEGRLLPAALVMGLGFNVKTFTAAWGGLSLAGAALIGKRGANLRGAVTTLVLMFLLFVLAATPTLLWLAERWDSLAAAREAQFDFRDFLRAFYPGHAMLGFAATEEQFLGALLTLAFPLLWLWIRRDAPEAPWRRLLGLWLASLVVVVYGALLPLLSANQLLLNMTPLRIDAFLDWLSFIALAVAILGERKWRNLALGAALAVMTARWPAAALLLLWHVARKDEGRAWLCALLAAALALVIALSASLPMQPGAYDRQGGGLALAALLLALPWLVSRGSLLEVAPLLLVSALAGLDYAWAAGLLSPQPFPAALLVGLFTLTLLPRTRAAVPALPAFGAAVVTWTLAEGAQDLRVFALLGLATLGPPALLALRRAPPVERLAPLAAAGVLALLLAFPLLHLWQTGRIDRYGPADLAFFDLQRWAREATPPDSLFLQPDQQLVPNLTPSFWTYARRPAWVDWRQGAAVHWLPDFYPLWRERMEEAGDLESVAQKLAYAREKEIPYVILSAEEDLPESAPAPLYEDGYWRVLQAD